jgi:TnpA family transposase
LGEYVPVDFLTSEQKASYGQFSGEPNEVQLARYFHLDEADLAFILQRRGDQNRFGVALQLGCVRFLGTFLADLSRVPANAQWFVARQLGITDLAILSTYAQRETTRREHMAQIRSQYQYREFTWPWSFRLSRLLYTRSWISNERPSLLFDLATGWLIQHKILLPGATTMTRLISEVRERATSRLWQRLSALPTSEQTAKLETLLQVPEGTRTSRFDRYRKGPVTISGPAFNEAVGRYKELLLEIDAHTSFADEFTHVSESNARAEDLNVSVCAVLLAEACNIGLEPLIKHQIPALTRHRLNWVKQNYLRAETLVKANAKLVDYQSNLSLAGKWGGGEVASADGMRFVTPIRTINAGPNRKYFGSSRGITWYNFLSDQFSGFHGIVVPGTLRDSIFVLEGLLEQQTGLNPVEIMTDTAGASDMVFGLFWLLGYQFSPRLADAGESVFWRVDKTANYGALNELARSCVNTHKIEQHWDDMMRIAGSLKLGTVQASELIRSLLKSDRPSSLAQAIIEAGRINKTLYLLNYVDDEDYRRRILTQLNRGESRHAVARAICHGQRGEIRKRYREGQEDQLGALGLVTNALVLWNTIYMQAALDHLRRQGEDVKEENEARLSPLSHKHVNVLGHYSFTLAEQVLNGQLRPLKQQSDLDE